MAREFIDVPRSVAICPRCNGDLVATVVSYYTLGEEHVRALVAADCSNNPGSQCRDLGDCIEANIVEDWVRNHVRVKSDGKLEY